VELDKTIQLGDSKMRSDLLILVATLFLMTTQTYAQEVGLYELRPALKEISDVMYVDSNTRLGYIQRAALWQLMNVDSLDLRAGQQIFDKQGRSKILPNDAIVECTYRQEALGGTTNKFKCDFNSATDVLGNPIDIQLGKLKVRYNSLKTYSAVITTRLEWALGFGADIETPVTRVLCHGCSKDPFKQKAAVNGDSVFLQASIETHMQGKDGIYVEGTRYSKDNGKDDPAWFWSELQNINDPARKAQADALILFATFLKHGDSKAIQNKLLCLTKLNDKGFCKDPFLYVHDFGNTFGSDGLSVHPLDFKRWSSASLWRDQNSCVVKNYMNIGNGPGLSDTEISEAGRRLFADGLSNLIQHGSKLRDIFDAAKIQNYDDHGSRYSADDWVNLFKSRAAQIINHPTCPRSL
jgi:hypothetical protein